jgi:hypothetical protein
MGTLGSMLFAIVAFMMLMIAIVVGLFVFFGAKWIMGTGNGLTADEMKLLKEQFSKKAQAEKEAALAAKLKDITTPKA